MEGKKTRRLSHVTGCVQVLHSNRQIRWNTPPYVVVAQTSKKQEEEKNKCTKINVRIHKNHKKDYCLESKQMQFMYFGYTSSYFI
jgi:hypothetical protein